MIMDEVYDILIEYTNTDIPCVLKYNKVDQMKGLDAYSALFNDCKEIDDTLEKCIIKEAEASNQNRVALKELNWLLEYVTGLQTLSATLLGNEDKELKEGKDPQTILYSNYTQQGKKKAKELNINVQDTECFIVYNTKIAII